MIQIKVLSDQKNGVLSGKTRKDIFQEEVEKILREEPVFKMKKMEVLFLQAEIPKNPGYISLELAINVKESPSTDFYESLIKKIRIGLKKSRVYHLQNKEKEKLTLGIEIREGRNTFWG